MKVTPLIAATVLALGLSPAVQAQYRGYPSNPGSGSRWDGDRTYTLAHQVDETATRIRYQMERYSRRHDRSESRVLAAVYDLDRAASHFHREVESYRQDGRHTDADFIALVRAFDNASRAMRWIEPRSSIDRGMDRIAGLLSDLSRYYGRSYSYYGRGRGYGDRNGDRYDRDGRYDNGGRHDRRGDDRDDYDRDNDGYRPPANRH